MPIGMEEGEKYMQSRMRQLALGLGLIFILGGCGKDVAETTPSVLVPATPSPSPSVQAETASPTPSATLISEPVESEELSYTLSDFCPSENLFISYLLTPGDSQQESYIEYRKQKGENELLQRRYISGGREPYVEVVAYSPEEIVRRFSRQRVGYTYDFTSRNDGAQTLLKEPIQVGTEWEIEGGKSRITAVGQLVTLPMGEVRVVEVNSQLEDGTRERTLYMEDLGMVAHYEYDAAGQLVAGQEASEYESGRKFIQTIRFFYADYADGRGKIYYRPREVELESNPAMEKIFRDFLQNTPSDSTLLPLALGIDIKSISLRGRSVYINFSDELGYMADQLNLNRRVEPAFLQALVNTFGEYYQADKVYLQIEGEPYASKFRVWTEDDYLSPSKENVERYR